MVNNKHVELFGQYPKPDRISELCCEWRAGLISARKASEQQHISHKNFRKLCRMAVDEKKYTISAVHSGQRRENTLLLRIFIDISNQKCHTIR